MKYHLLFGATVAAFCAETLYAAGLEKNVLWSGKYNGFAGAATSSVNDSEGMFFNPAGLAFLDGKGDIRANFSPTISQFQGPVSSTQSDEKSKQDFAPIGALTGAYRFDDSIVFGAGVFVSGGTQARFDDVQAVSGGGFGTSESHLRLIEGTLGVAKKFDEHFSVGVAWRVTYATADLATVVPVATGVQVDFANLKTFDLSGFRMGAQWRNENMGFGLMVRTPINLSLKGDAAVGLAGGQTTVVDDDARVKATFPLQIALGSDFQLSQKWRLLSDFSYTNYRADQALGIDAKGSGAFGPVVDGIVAKGGIPLKWNDLYVLRLGTEWQAWERVALRAGYALISQVTSKDFARATFASPGFAHSFTVGAGSKWGKLDANLALDYSFASGHSDGNPDAQTLEGDYSSHSYTAHLGVGYTF